MNVKFKTYVTRCDRCGHRCDAFFSPEFIEFLPRFKKPVYRRCIRCGHKIPLNRRTVTKKKYCD